MKHSVRENNEKFIMRTHILTLASEYSQLASRWLNIHLLFSCLDYRSQRSSIGIDEEHTDKVHFWLHQFSAVCGELIM